MTALQNCRRSHIATSRMARFRQRNSGFFPYSDKSDSRREQVVLCIFNVIRTQSMCLFSPIYTASSLTAAGSDSRPGGFVQPISNCHSGKAQARCAGLHADDRFGHRGRIARTIPIAKPASKENPGLAAGVRFAPQFVAIAIRR
ncbi:hypothetical protein [Lysobacter sp. Root690]|uniref:hypothetical protein n=1 Tax=Lysobacter sp. Root690 TaxID=1736588 RepID=UPI0012F7AA88|nr:hypothetical protein [Lysobacter sp. Root690]